MARYGVVIDRNTLTPNIKEMAPRLQQRVDSLVGYTAQRGQDWMRSHAPWTDRTSNARNGLFGTSYAYQNGYRITFYHTMPYGIFLETRWDGKYQVIMPTVQKMGSELMKGLNKLLKAMS